jgi:hypothetical protein
MIISGFFLRFLTKKVSISGFYKTIFNRTTIGPKSSCAKQYIRTSPLLRRTIAMMPVNLEIFFKIANIIYKRINQLDNDIEFNRFKLNVSIVIQQNNESRSRHDHHVWKGMWNKSSWLLFNKHCRCKFCCSEMR